MLMGRLHRGSIIIVPILFTMILNVTFPHGTGNDYVMLCYVKLC